MTEDVGAYRRIADNLRHQIATGDLAPGALLPSEPELSREYGVSRQTARVALQALEQEGLVLVRPRRGRIVRSTKRLTWRLSEFELPENTGPAVAADAWDADIERQGHEPTREDLTVETIRPPKAVSERLGLDPGRDLCVVRRHVRYVDNKATITADDYFDESIVRGTELAAPESTTREDILKEAGYEQTHDVDEIITRMPTPDEVRTLGIGTGTPVAELTRTAFTASGKAVRVMVAVIPGDTLVLQYKIRT
jgi:GntR family transcriptional regulator